MIRRFLFRSFAFLIVAGGLCLLSACDPVCEESGTLRNDSSYSILVISNDGTTTDSTVVQSGQSHELYFDIQMGHCVSECLVRFQDSVILQVANDTSLKVIKLPSDPSHWQHVEGNGTYSNCEMVITDSDVK